MNDKRQPKGIPVGGQFAASERNEPKVSLAEQFSQTEPETRNVKAIDLRFGDVAWLGGAHRLVTRLELAEDDDQILVAFDYATDPADAFPFGKDAVIALVEPAPLTAAEFGEAATASQALRRLDTDAPQARVTLPDGSVVGCDPEGSEGSVVGSIIEEGAYLIERPDGSTSVRAFSDLAERAQVSDDIAYTAAREARFIVKDPEPAQEDVFPEGTVRNDNGTATGPDGTTYVDNPDSFWHGTEIISVYTRNQALADGVLRERLADGTDLSQLAKEAGIPVPVAFTSEAYRDSLSWPETNAESQDETGRAWDALTMAARPIRAHAMRHRGQIAVGDRIPFSFIRVPNTPRATVPRKVEMVAVFGVDDTGKPCFTFMMPHED